MASEPANGNSMPSVILGSSSAVGTSSAASSMSSLTLRDQQHHVEGAKERKERQMRRLAAEMDDQRSKWVLTSSYCRHLLFRPVSCVAWNVDRQSRKHFGIITVAHWRLQLLISLIFQGVVVVEIPNEFRVFFPPGLPFPGTETTARPFSSGWKFTSLLTREIWNILYLLDHHPSSYFNGLTLGPRVDVSPVRIV